ncbi:MAG TPA: hypothetical protein VH187_01565 [Scandinavium sp.]|uniref:hypothetical protein n=1 Tax=Scandinavium sp. TaxID=2830653 RepID=UPI002E35DDE1|nr:hypothetical protein [Scandinavium sp.]HEX4499846.1 hypothetical protein [Scandinavium sp.]
MARRLHYYCGYCGKTCGPPSPGNSCIHCQRVFHRDCREHHMLDLLEQRAKEERIALELLAQQKKLKQQLQLPKRKRKHKG